MPARVMLIEGDRPTADLIKLGLSRLNLDIDHHLDGADVLARLVQRRPALLLVDMLVPGLNTLELIGEMRRRGWLRQTQVVVISALGFKEVVQQAIQMGAVDFLVKPLSVDALVEKTSRWLGLQVE
ncbi:MAG TPA: response regulator [Anaerolineaceae bacterium]|nr:response regulator [Anaerolineaceae bacterium]HPN52814.1 response regulator [Anaerolineaceae bacterium]